MEALSTYKTLQEIAVIAATKYNSQTTPEDYADSVVKVYQTDKAPEKIRKNVYYRHLLETYPGTVRNEVVRIIEARNAGAKLVQQ